MSGGLMSCVRENSPPLEMDINVSGPLSLPEPSINNSDLMGSLHSSSHHNIMSSTPLAAQSSSHIDVVGSGGGSTPHATPPNTEQTKRRRFHPLRNLRRIFRRRTITSATTAAGETPTSTLTGPAASSNSEKNLRSATLGATSVVSVVSASSPSSPLTHQQLQDAYLTQSLPKSKSAYSSLLAGKKHQSHDFNLNSGGGNETKSKSKHKHKNHQKQHQQQSKEFEQQQQQQSEDMFGTTTQTSASYHHQHVQHHTSTTASSGTTAATKSSLLSQRQSMGVAVFPGAMNRSFFTERQKLRSVGDSSQDLDSGSGNDSGTGGGHNISAGDRTKSGGGGSASGGEMSDSQRSLSEGRLVDSDYSRDGLSQSHDSVFSESATASSLSIVLKAELADVLRKRRNRPDASDEDLGLPRSPASPQRRAAHGTTAAPAAPSSNTKSATGEKYTEISSISLLSMNSTDVEDAAMATSTANNSTASTDIVQERTTATRYSRSSTMSSISMSNDILRHRDSSFPDVKDEVDLFSSDWQRLSHSAAKHKMAIRPIKKKGGPSRQHRRTLETSIPEANEDLNRFVNKQILEVKDLDIKAKTRSLPPIVNAAKLMDEQKLAINVKNTATNNPSITTTTKESITKTTKIINTTTSSTTTSTTNLTPANLFGLRNLTAKASAMFESKDSNSIPERREEEITQKLEDLPQKSQLNDKSLIQPMETTGTGFLRRLMHRNSKRSIAKANAGEGQDQDELDKKQNEPKKLQMSTAKTVTQSAVSEEKSKSEFISLESSVEEKRKEIKRELYNEGKTVGLTNIVNNFTMPSKEDKKLEEKPSAPSKPKSGPAARQRYLPQNISNEDLMKLNEDKTQSKETMLSKTSLNETFQSTSIIREITKQQTSITNSSTKVEHHFEKKPKIVGLSAFQQKISRSNDSFARNSSTNNSLVSLDKSEEELATTPIRLTTYEQKQRKSVEKSRSFRAYGDQKDLTPHGVHNNMPSLPDLSLNLRVPYCRDFILNEKEYSSPSPPEPLDEKHASLGFEINDNKLVKPERDIRKSFGNYDKNIIMTTSTGGVSPSKTTPTKLLTPANVVSTFSASSTSATCNKNISEIENNIDLIVKSPFVSVIRKSINLNEDQAEEVVKMSTPKTTTEKVRPTVLALKKEKFVNEDFNLDSPSTASVTLREKAIVKTNTLFISNLENTKDLERKSAPANNGTSKTNGFRANSTRRSSSVVEAIEDKPKSSVPEFMKIQLNRVDATRTSKSHLVLAKNIKETSISRESTPEKNSSMDDLSFRRLSSESVDINERDSPETEKRISGIYYEAINKHNKVCAGLPPKSPVKKTPTTPTTPPTPTINERDSQRESFKLPESFESTSSSLSLTNSLSLQERRRLFMSEEKSKLEKKVEDIKYERKKSICEDISRKSSIKSDTEHKDITNDNTVILRKKSFASSVHSLNGNSLNGNSLNNPNTTNNNVTGKDDATPELMKVFARRSLKIKDEDLDKMLINTANNNLSNATQSLKKFTPTCSQPSVDSDKENQSASDEKLDKLPKLELPQSITITKLNSSQTHTTSTALLGSSSLSNNNNGNRNSLADFRLGSTKTSNTALSLNNSNNNNYTSNGETSPVNNIPKSFLPPIKVQPGFRAISVDRSSNNNNNNPVSPTKTSCSTLERSTIKLGDLTTSSSTDSPIIISKTIERSATMGEFKGIHQRRAEWEQRAKEALK